MSGTSGQQTTKPYSSGLNVSVGAVKSSPSSNSSGGRTSGEICHCKASREGQNKMAAELQQLKSDIDKVNAELVRSNAELMEKANTLQLEVTTLRETINQLQLQVQEKDRILTEKATEDAETIEDLRAQLLQTKQQLQDFIGQQSKVATSSGTGSYPNCSPYPKATPGLCGLGNLGHSCYMNAALQCLNCTVLFRDHFLHCELKGPSELVDAYKKLVAEMWSGENHTLRPERLAHETAKLCSHFDGKSPQDAQEFLSWLLENLRDDMKGTEELSIITDLFQGKQQSSVICSHCGNVTTRNDPFMFLSIAIPLKREKYSSPNWNVQSGLEYVNTEESFEENQWYCTSCHKKPRCTRTTEVSESPKILILHLKRFKITDYGIRQKVNTPVDFPLIDLELSDSKTVSSYNLFGVINHIGSIQGGCYKASVMHEQKWYQFFDRCMQPLTEDEIVTPDAYVLFYQRVRQQDFLSTPGLYGIPNYAKISYISATMQAFFSLSAMLEYFQQYSSKGQELNESATKNFQKLMAVIRLLSRIQNGKGACMDDIKCLSLEFGDQGQDLHQFIELLLMDIYSCEKAIIDRSSQQLQFSNSQQSQETRGLSLHDIFEGIFQSQTGCSKCAFRMSGPHQVSCISLAVQVPGDSQESVHLDSCLQMGIETLFQEHTSSHSEYSRCSVCYNYDRPARITQLLKYSRVLMIHLKRVCLNRMNKEEKVDTVVNFPEVIQLSSSEPGPTYELKAVINHYGATIDGHYTVYRKYEGKWYCCDGIKVTYVPTFEEVATPVACILLYEIRNPGS